MSLFHQHPFEKSVKCAESWTDSRYFCRQAVSRPRFQANMLGLRLSPNLSHGRSFRQVEKRIGPEAVETGIVSQK